MEPARSVKGAVAHLHPLVKQQRPLRVVVNVKSLCAGPKRGQRAEATPVQNQ